MGHSSAKQSARVCSAVPDARASSASRRPFYLPAAPRFSASSGAFPAVYTRSRAARRKRRPHAKRNTRAKRGGRSERERLRSMGFGRAGRGYVRESTGGRAFNYRSRSQSCLSSPPLSPLLRPAARRNSALLLFSFADGRLPPARASSRGRI